MSHPRIAILASGEGTTAESFIRANAAGEINARVGLIICNNPKAGIFKRARDLAHEFGLAIPTLLINSTTNPATDGKIKRGEQSDSEQQAILDTLRSGDFDAVVLMGYMKKVGLLVVQHFGWRPTYTSPFQAIMLNTHPGLLPETKGLYGSLVQKYVMSTKLSFGGQTLHIVAEDYDDGPIITEHKVAVQPNDTPESLFTRVRDAEKKYLPRDIDEFIKNRQNYLMKAKNGS